MLFGRGSYSARASNPAHPPLRGTFSRQEKGSRRAGEWARMQRWSFCRFFARPEPAHVSVRVGRTLMDLGQDMQAQGESTHAGRAIVRVSSASGDARNEHRTIPGWPKPPR